MSLFGSSQSQTTSSLFAGLGTSSSTTNNSLFSGVNATTPATSQAAQPSSSLFGQPSQNPPQTSAAPTKSLFDRLSGASSQQTQQQSTTGSASGSLFGGNLGTTQKPLNAPGPGGLFSGLGSAHPSNGPLQQPSSQLGGPLFGESILYNNPASGSEQTPRHDSSSTSALFSVMLERDRHKKKALGQGASQFTDLPSLQLGLGDIASKVRNLGGAGSTASSTRRGNGRTHDLLAASGVPRGSTVRDLNTLGASVGARNIASTLPDDLDIESYVTNLRAKSTQDLINDSLEQTKRDFNTFLEENVQMNWHEQRQRIHEHFGISKPTDRRGESLGGFTKSTTGAQGSARNNPSMSFSTSAMSKSILGGSVSRGTQRTSLFSDVAERSGSNHVPSAAEDPFTRAKQEKYAAKVRQLNISRKQGALFPVVEEFARVEIDEGTTSNEHLIDAYRALKAITKEDSMVRDPLELGAIKERHYAPDYLDENISSAKAIAIRKQILDGSRHYLEDNFFEQLDTMVQRNPQEANLGGVPSKINKVRAFLRIKAARKDLSGEGAELQMLGDDYCWALIYHLLRCGLVAEAADYVVQNGRAFKSLDSRFPSYMAAFARDSDRRLPREMQTRINSEYSQRVKLAPENSIDPYRMACYKVVGRCDLSHKNIEDITLQMKDWIWLLFSLAREVNRVEEAAGEYFGLDDARALIEQIGQRHFTAGADNANNYATFFLMQILAGLFEKAVSYLYPHNYVAAVHFAIALDYYGLLRVSDPAGSDAELLTYSTRTNPQINFARMLGYYTRDFRLARAETAADYIVLICLNSDLPGAAGEAQSLICQQALKELVLETRDFALLLGDIQGNGQKTSGAIHERLPLINLTLQNDFLHSLTMQAAMVADESGRVSDAVLLYHLADEYDKVIEIINRTLSDALVIDLGQDDLRLEPLKPGVTSDTLGGQTARPEMGYTFSLTSVEDPVVLARNMITLYDADAFYFRKIRDVNRNACGQLLRLSEIRSNVAGGRSGQALDDILDLGIIPLRAENNISLIRSSAQGFNLLPQVVARVIGNLLIWTISCLGRERDNLVGSEFVVNKGQAEAMVQAAKDVMVFAGLIRYKLPADVFDMLARAGQNVGV